MSETKREYLDKLRKELEAANIAADLAKQRFDQAVPGSREENDAYTEYEEQLRIIAIIEYDMSDEDWNE